MSKQMRMYCCPREFAASFALFRVVETVAGSVGLAIIMGLNATETGGELSDSWLMRVLFIAVPHVGTISGM